MRVHEFIFSVLNNFVPGDQEVADRLKIEIKEKYDSVSILDAEGKEIPLDKLPSVYHKLKFFVESPFFRLFLYCAYVPMVIWIKRLWNGYSQPQNQNFGAYQQPQQTDMFGRPINPTDTPW